MSVGEYLRNERNTKGLSQRDLAELSGVTNAKISRIESGIRKNPAPKALEALGASLGIIYPELLEKAGYIEYTTIIKDYLENRYKDENGEIFDIVVRAKDMYDRDSEWAELAYKVVNSNLTKAEIDTIKAVVGTLIEQFLKNNEK